MENEKINTSSNSKRDAWEDVVDYGKEHPIEENKNNLVETTDSSVLAQKKQEEIEQTAKKVKELYRKGKYDRMVRSAVDEIKTDLRDDNVAVYRRKQIKSQPGAFRKAIRLVGDKLNLSTRKSRERRRGEAIYIALTEYEEEKKQKKAIEEQERSESLKRAAEREKRLSEWRAKDEAERLQRDEEAANKAFSEAMDNYYYSTYKGRFERQRAQELFERELNSRLLKTEDLDAEAYSGNPMVERSLVSFEDTEIPVYSLKGIPFSILSTTIDFKADKTQGAETAREVMKDPSVWMMPREEVKKDDNFGAVNNMKSKGDTISCSYYTSSEGNIDNYIPGELVYGFENVGADSVIEAYNGDGMTGNMIGQSETRLSDAGALQRLTEVTVPGHHNEVVLRRYDENGNPKLPNYIVVRNGKISDVSIRHAKYFNIPIVNIDRSAYRETE
ncbi:hypothetical protein IJH15_03385 [Candidatus Saccharibacteria bacterium]|nr:hypothetical protein [Candidatus Saccharibacteria bacterium]MBR3253351.1 hypothetical protein [Candidatus Saccharibacteria bacterium]